MTISEFETVNLVPKDFSGFWKCTKHNYIGYHKNGAFENIFGACAFYPSGTIAKIVSKIHGESIHKQFPFYSGEAKQTWLEFKLYMITNNL